MFVKKICQVNDILRKYEPDNIKEWKFEDNKGEWKSYFSYDVLEVKLALIEVFGFENVAFVYEPRYKICTLSLRVGEAWLTRQGVGSSEFSKPALDQAFLNACYEFVIGMRAFTGDLERVYKEEHVQELVEDVVVEGDLYKFYTKLDESGVKLKDFRFWLDHTYGIPPGEMDVLNDDQKDTVKTKLREFKALHSENGQDLKKKVKKND